MFPPHFFQFPSHSPHYFCHFCCTFLHLPLTCCLHITLSFLSFPLSYFPIFSHISLPFSTFLYSFLTFFPGISPHSPHISLFSHFFSLRFLSFTFLSLTFLYSAVSSPFPPRSPHYFCHFPPILPSRSSLTSLSPMSLTLPSRPPHAQPAQWQRTHRHPARSTGRQRGRGGLTPHSTWRRATPKMAAAGGKRRVGRRALKMAPGGAKGDGGRRARAARHAAARHAPCRDVPCVRGAR